MQGDWRERGLGAQAVALVLLVLGLVASARAAPPSEAIEAFIDRELPASGAPSVAYALVLDGEVDTVGARGIAADTPFLTGSISKSFTALAVMQLVEAGKLDLDDTVDVHLEAFAGRPAGKISIRQLLGHSSGYSTMQGNRRTGDEGAGRTLEAEVEQLASLAPANPPGTSWAYSNANYQILGRVIEVVSGESYGSYIESKILRPIGMEHSFVADGEIHPEVARGHVPWFATKRQLPPYQTPASAGPQGGVLATAEDLARYMQTLLNGQDDVLSAAGKAALLQPADEVATAYGLGWFLDLEGGRVWHSGASPGTETLATMIPARRAAVVVLINAGSGMGFGMNTQLSQGITARALGLDEQDVGGNWGAKLTFSMLLLLPLGYAASTVWAWLGRAELRAKTGAFGLFSLWFPLLTTVLAATFILTLVPLMFGAPLSTVRRFSPDLALCLTATAVCGVVWALLRLAIAYTGRSGAGG